MKSIPTTAAVIPSIVHKLYPKALFVDVKELVIAFFIHHIALAENKNGYVEEILYNRAFSKVDVTRFKEAPGGQEKRYKAVKELMLAQLALICQRALEDYEECCTDCILLITEHTTFIKEMEEKLSKATGVEQETIQNEINLAGIMFLQAAHNLKERARRAKLNARH